MTTSKFQDLFKIVRIMSLKKILLILITSVLTIQWYC